MYNSDEVTYRSLIKPIPPSVNLSNVDLQEPFRTCSHCSTIVPDRSNEKVGIIKTPYERVDLFPYFPELKSSAKAGCCLCKLIRKTVRSAWAARPMEEWGYGPLSEKDSYWDDLFRAPWNRKVKIHSAQFTLLPTSTAFPSDVRSPSQGRDGMVANLSFEFGPLTQDGEHGDISQIVSFRVFDGQGL